MPEESIPTYNIVQKANRELLRWIGAGAGPIFMAQLIPGIKNANYSIKVSQFSINGYIGDMVMALLGKTNPLADLKQLGNDRIWMGSLKTVASAAISIIPVAAGAYLLNKPLTQVFGDMNNIAIVMPVLGTAGYVVSSCLDQLSLATMNYFSPPGVAQPQKPQLNLLQKFLGQVVFTAYGNITIAETILFYLRYAKLTKLAHDTQFQIGALMLTHSMMRTLRYWTLTPEPLKALTNTPTPLTNDVEASTDETATSTTTALATAYAALKACLVEGVYLSLGWAAAELYIYLTTTPGQDDNLVTDRLKRDSVAATVTLGSKFLVENLGPCLKKLSIFRCAPSSNEDEQPLLFSNVKY